MLVWIATALILLLVAMGSFIGTGKRTLPIGTPLFVLFYSFLVPLWLGTAVVRAVYPCPPEHRKETCPDFACVRHLDIAAIVGTLDGLLATATERESI